MILLADDFKKIGADLPRGVPPATADIPVSLMDGPDEGLVDACVGVEQAGHPVHLVIVVIGRWPAATGALPVLGNLLAFVDTAFSDLVE